MHMNRIAVWLFCALGLPIALAAQTPPFRIVVEAEPFADFPALQSFSIGEYNGHWIILAGRKDGLHRRQPFAAFAPAGANAMIYVARLADKSILPLTTNDLPNPIREQLSATNLEFCQRGEWLYLIGGYGFSAAQAEFVTYPYLTAVHLPTLLTAAASGQSIAPAFRTRADERMQVTGGYLHRLDDVFYLVGGQHFRGRYNPMGPDHGPGFFQTYANAIKRFEIEHTPDGGLNLLNYTETIDTLQLHRRDFNLAPQIFPDGSRGFTAFSGVFRYDADLPWLNVVDIRPDGHAPHPTFNQYLNQYHTANAGLYDAANHQMYTLFLGGISQFYPDAQGILTEDLNVPFVNTISLVARSANGELAEYKVGEMPALLGAGAVFMPAAGHTGAAETGIITLNGLPPQRLLLGYVVGGINSTAPNVLFTDNNGSLSSASAQLWRVYLEPEAPTGLAAVAETYFALEIFPNPTDGALTISFLLPAPDAVKAVVTDAQGRLIDQSAWDLPAGSYEWTPERLKGRPPGAYWLQLKGRSLMLSRQIIVE